MTNPDLLTRAEAAEYLRVSQSQLAHGWGPRPLPHYRRPVMYSRSDLDQWIEAQRTTGAACSTAAAQSGGSSSVTPARSTVDPQIRQIIEQRRHERAKSASRSISKSVLVVVDRE